MALYRSYAQLIQFLEEEAMITVEIMLAPKFNMALLYDLLVPIADSPHMGMPLPQTQWDRLVETVRSRNKPPPVAPIMPADPNVAAAPVLAVVPDGAFYAAFLTGWAIINPPDGFVGLKDRNVRLSLSTASLRDPRWDYKLGSYQEKRKEAWDRLPDAAQALFAHDADPVDVSRLPVLFQTAIKNMYETHCGPLHLLWLQMWIYEKTTSCISRFSIHETIQRKEDRLVKAFTGVDDTKEPPPRQKRTRDSSPTGAPTRIA